MHVRSSGDPVEITGERDSLAINCDLSECTHAITHTMDMPMSNVQLSVEDSFIHCRECAEEASCLEVENWHMYLLIFI
jgi:hypothetical protein